MPGHIWHIWVAHDHVLSTGSAGAVFLGFKEWGTANIQLDRFWPPLSSSTTEQISNTVQRLLKFTEEEYHQEKDLFDKAMQLETIFAFAKHLAQKGRTNKYLADQVCTPNQTLQHIFNTGT
jgi:hypothetical protein